MSKIEKSNEVVVASNELEFKKVKGRLALRLTFGVFLLSMVFAALSVIVCTRVYRKNLLEQIASDNCVIAQGISDSISQKVDCTVYADKLVRIFKSMTKEELENQYAEGYRSKFAVYENNEDLEFIKTSLRGFKKATDIRDAYIFTYDPESENCIYLADPDVTDNRCLVGEHEYVTPENFAGYLKSNENDPYTTIYHSLGEKVMTTGVGIYGSGGHKCVVLLDVTIDSIDVKTKNFAIIYMSMMVVVSIIIAVIAGFVATYKLVRPINKIAKASMEYVNDKQEYIQNKKLAAIKKNKNIKVDKVGEHFSKLKIRTGDEIENLANSLKVMEKDLKTYEKDLKKITAEKERISAELNLATNIQADALPSNFPVFTERKEFDIYAKMTPAKEVGGDFYDFFLIDNDHLGLVMADVSGKGVPAALFMMNAKNLIKNYAMLGFGPAETLHQVNLRICESNDADLFVTVWFGILDINTGIITAANAGHDYPAVMHEGGAFALDENVHGMVVGLMDMAKFTDYEIKLEPGSKIFLYTDGVPEATRNDKKMYGLDRMIKTLSLNKNLNPENLIRIVREDVDEFVEDADQFDDITMLCVHYKGIE